MLTTPIDASLKLPRADVFQHHPRALEVCSYLAVLQRATCSFDEGALVSLFLAESALASQFSAKCCLRICLVAILVHKIVIGQVEIIARLLDQALLKFLIKLPCSSLKKREMLPFKQ